MENDAVGDDQLDAGVGVELEFFFQMAHVRVLERVGLGFAQAHAVDDRGVHQAVGDHHVLFAQNGFKHSGVGVHAGWEENGVFSAQEFRQLGLEFLVDVLGAADEAHRGHAVAAGVQSFSGRFDHIRVGGKAQVVVGAHVDRVLAFCAGWKFHFYISVLRGADNAFFLEYPGCTDAFEFILVNGTDVVIECHAAPTGC